MIAEKPYFTPVFDGFNSASFLNGCFYTWRKAGLLRNVAVKNLNVKTPLNHTGSEALFLRPSFLCDSSDRVAATLVTVLHDAAMYNTANGAW